jgi:hypothetical protein
MLNFNISTVQEANKKTFTDILVTWDYRDCGETADHHINEGLHVILLLSAIDYVGSID